VLDEVVLSFESAEFAYSCAARVRTAEELLTFLVGDSVSMHRVHVALKFRRAAEPFPATVFSALVFLLGSKGKRFTIRMVLR